MTFRSLALWGFSALCLYGNGVAYGQGAAAPSPKAVLTEPGEKLPTTKPELIGKHPRLLVSEAELQQAIHRYQADPAWAQIYFRPDGIELTTAPKPFDPKDTSAPSSIVGKLAVAYAVTGNVKYLDKLRLWLPFIREQKPVKIIGIGRSNDDLLSGYLLTALALSYDVLKGRVDADVEGPIREALVRQARVTYGDLIAISRYPYEQNHFSIPVNGLLVAALALLDEEKEAPLWAAWSHRAAVRCLDALSPDGWFYEGMNYWGFTLQFPTIAATALERTTGENLFEKPVLKNSALYLAHNFLPDPNFVFDFADWGPRVQPDGKGAQSGYEKPWHTHPTRIPKFIPFLVNRAKPNPLLEQFLNRAKANDASLNGMVGALLQMSDINPDASPVDLTAYPPYHYFSDMEVVHWRNDWSDPNATAIAFKSGPPGGHFMTPLLKQFPDWKPSLGHAHPDAGSFILFSKGVFLANDTGYAVKETAWHNSILVDGVGQEKGGTAFVTFKNLPYDKLNKIRMSDVWLSPQVLAGTADFAAAYDDALGLTDMRRSLILVEGRYLVILDRMQASIAHEYEWRLHGDKLAEEVSPGRFVMTNRTGQLIIQNLQPIASASVAPTIVETELYDFKNRSRPQQRGFHIALKSPQAASAQFLTAMLIQSSTEKEDQFRAAKVEEGKVELSDGKNSCTIWIGKGRELKGTFAYVIKDQQGIILSAGLQGEELRSGGFSIKAQSPIAIGVTWNQSSGLWKTLTADLPSHSVTIQANGKTQVITGF